jgi:hypothetical protein
MAESLVLTAPIVPPTPPTLAEYQVIRFGLDRATSESFVMFVVRSNTGRIVEAKYVGAAADAMISALNTVNLSTKSLQKRILERMVADGFIPAGTVTGTPD